MKKAMASVGRWFKRVFTQNLGMKIGALAFAFILWSFVIAEQNPPREKIFRDIPVTFTATEDMKMKNLTSSIPLSEVLSSATVTIQARAQDLDRITPGMISVSVDLSTVNDVGEYTLPVQATTTTSLGSVVNISPSQVSLKIQEVVTQEVPVEVQYVGDKKDWLYYGEPVVSEQTVQVTGSRDNLKDVAKAVCYINIQDMEASSKETHPVVLKDKQDKEIPAAFFTGIPSIIVEVPIYPKKEVKIDQEAIVKNVTGVAPGYEVASVSLSSDTVNIAGKLEDINQIESIMLAPIVLEDATGNTIVTAKPLLPEGVVAVIPDEIQVQLTIAQPKIEKTYDAMDLSIKNLGQGLRATLEPEAIDVKVSGVQSALDALRADNLNPFVDLNGLLEGVHNVEVKFENLPDLGVEVTPNVQTVTVTIKKR